MVSDFAPKVTPETDVPGRAIASPGATYSSAAAMTPLAVRRAIVPPSPCPSLGLNSSWEFAFSAAVISISPPWEAT